MTNFEREQIAEVLDRRAIEITGLSDQCRRDSGHFGIVELAFSRGIPRLRRLSDRVNPAEPEEETP